MTSRGPAGPLSAPVCALRHNTGKLCRMADITRLPGRNEELWEWQLHARCRGMDSAWFFHPEAERGPRKEQRDAAAKAICEQCPVIHPCREHALQVREPYGVWGGLTEDDRERLLGAVRAH